MSRLVLICAPICSILCAIWCGFLLDHILEPFFLLLGKKGCAVPEAVEHKETNEDKKEDGTKPKKTKANNATSKKSQAGPAENVVLQEWEEDLRPGGMAQMKRAVKSSYLKNVHPKTVEARSILDNNINFLLLRAALAIAGVAYVTSQTNITEKVGAFTRHCDGIARSMSTAKVKFKVPQKDGTELMVDDYWQGYLWLDKNTPKDSRIMAWWDYGYQITGIAKRTTIADGNTWNHEHIATLGRILTSPQKKAHNAIRHLADYVLVWAGGRGDDLAKSSHLARIGNSVFPDHCGDDDPTCSKFGFHDPGRRMQPTPMMEKSLLFNLVMNNLQGTAKAQRDLFEEVWTSQYGLMRIYKVGNVSEESKDWVADPKNRICDAPGSWYCVGQYPPALNKLIAMRRSFSQVEDFNKQGEKSAYTKMIEKERSKEL